MRIIAHRGFGTPENTVFAFEKARAVNADGIEFDVQRTADHYWVIHHDKKTKSGKVVHQSKYEDIEDEVENLNQITGFKDMWLNFEIKYYENKDPIGYGAEFARYILDEIGAEEFNVSSFEPKCLIGSRKVDQDIKLSYLSLLPKTSSWKKYHRKIGLFSVNPMFVLLRKKHTELAKRLGVEVHPWTVNRPKSIKRMIGYKVEALITDNPDVAIAIRANGNS